MDHIGVLARSTRWNVFCMFHILRLAFYKVTTKKNLKKMFFILVCSKPKQPQTTSFAGSKFKQIKTFCGKFFGAPLRPFANPFAVNINIWILWTFSLQLTSCIHYFSILIFFVNVWAQTEAHFKSFILRTNLKIYMTPLKNLNNIFCKHSNYINYSNTSHNVKHIPCPMHYIFIISVHPPFGMTCAPYLN